MFEAKKIVRKLLERVGTNSENHILKTFLNSKRIQWLQDFLTIQELFQDAEILKSSENNVLVLENF